MRRVFPQDLILTTFYFDWNLHKTEQALNQPLHTITSNFALYFEKSVCIIKPTTHSVINISELNLGYLQNCLLFGFTFILPKMKSNRNVNILMLNSNLK